MSNEVSDGSPDPSVGSSSVEVVRIKTNERCSCASSSRGDCSRFGTDAAEGAAGQAVALRSGNTIA